MKIKALTRLMNDHGTRPRINVLDQRVGCSVLIYEGNPNNISDKIAEVNSFTVLGKGFIEIYTQTERS